MNQFCSRMKVRLGDATTAVGHAAMPGDRPSPIFSLMVVLLNGGLMVWTFGTVLASECTPDTLAWVSLGISHAFINMFFAVFTIMVTRRRIANGIRLTVSTWRLFLFHPLYVLYCVYLLWEIVWMVVAAQKSVARRQDACANHMNVQVGFYVSYLLSGTLLFTVTFATEGFRLPRWRRHANVNWYMKNEPEALRRQGQLSDFDGEATAGSETMSHSSLASDEPAAPTTSVVAGAARTSITPSQSSARRPERQAQMEAQAMYEENRGRHLSPSGSRVGTRMRQLPSGALAWDAHDTDNAFTELSTARDWNDASGNGAMAGTPIELTRGAPTAVQQQQPSDRLTARSVHFRE